ncbi:ATP-binding cassette domain-containing protein [Pedobacter sp. HMF7647]|uniref:ATP-binding cassette domain-containing protein n=1 Tax=Hufsiella arboris TaxID=2695275 RepID=A0A7K1YE98_9SPHI|nr:ATP-binding cassette domain-containing protein [Hufsiella arboris]MXV52933.1 ATP-binding cassette domain-containing protein [Hufsiella arboris]
MSIQVENLTKAYGQQKAVDSISFSANNGRIMGFLGPNGAGKSTTMKILSCFIPQTSGKALVNGFDVLTNPVEAKRQVGYLPEHNPLYIEMYVKEYLNFIAELHQTPNKVQRIKEVIDLVGLGVEQNKKIAQLSKGYRQRVGIAQAILNDPPVLIMDEPTSGLDPNQLVDIRQLIRDLGKDKTIVFSTHIMQEVEAVCDDVVIINKGTLVENDSLQNIFSRHKSKSLEEIFIRLTSQNVVV